MLGKDNRSRPKRFRAVGNSINVVFPLCLDDFRVDSDGSAMPRFFSEIRRQMSTACYRGNRHAAMSFVFLLTVLSSGAPEQIAAQVSLSGPSAVRLGGTAQYSATAGGVTTPVVWSVNGFAGGTSSTGPISAAGLY